MRRNIGKGLLLLLAFSVSHLSLAKSFNYEKAVEAFQKEKVGEAYIHIKNELKANPQYLPALILLSEILIKQRKFHLAERELERAGRLGVDSDIWARMMGEVLLSQSKFDQALTYADQLILTDSAKTHYQLIQAKAYRALEKQDEAGALYQSILSQKPGELDANLGLVSVYLSQQRLSEAEAVLERISHDAVDSNEYWILLGRVYSFKGLHQQAVASYQKAVALAPQNIAALKALAIAYHVDLNDFNKAEEVIDNVLALSPQDPHALLIKSNVLASLDKTSVADQILLDLHSQLSRVDAQYLMKSSLLMLVDSITSYKLKKWEEASRKFEAYLSKERDINAAILLADTYIQLEEHFSAMKLLQGFKEELVSNLDQALVLASLYLHFEKHFDTSDYLSDLEERYPGNPSLLIMKAKSLAQLGKHQKALAALERSRERTSPAYQYALATALYNVSQPIEALTKVEALLEQQPENKEYLLFRARLLVHLEREEEAEQLISTLYASHLDDKEVSFAYASLLHSKGNAEKARPILEALTQQYPKDNRLWFLLASVEQGLGHVEKAIDLLKAKVKGDRLGATLALAKLYFQESRYIECINMAESALFQDRLNEQALLLKAKAYIAQKESTQAQRTLASLASLWSEDATHLLMLSRLQVANENQEESEKLLRRVLELSPDLPMAYVDLIKLKTNQKQLDEAEALLKHLESIVTNKPAYVAELYGDLAFANNRVEVAFKHYQKAFEQDPKNHTALLKLTKISKGSELQKKYSELVEKTLEQSPLNHFIRHTLADYYLARDLLEPSQHHLQILLTQPVPHFRRAIALNNLAFVHIKKQEYPLAIALSEQALQLIPQSPDFLDTHGWALTLSQKYSEGLGYLREAYVRDSSIVEVRFHLAYALAKVGRIREAQEIIKTIHNFPNGIADQALAQELLKTLN